MQTTSKQHDTAECGREARSEPGVHAEYREASLGHEALTVVLSRDVFRRRCAGCTAYPPDITATPRKRRRTSGNDLRPGTTTRSNPGRPHRSRLAHRGPPPSPPNKLPTSRLARPRRPTEQRASSRQHLHKRSTKRLTGSMLVTRIPMTRRKVLGDAAASTENEAV